MASRQDFREKLAKQRLAESSKKKKTKAEPTSKLTESKE